MCSEKHQNKKPIRVALVQPALAKYRIPVFRELANRPGIDLKVYYGERTGLGNVEPEGFESEYAVLRNPEILGQQFLFHGAQWRHATPKSCDVLIINWTPRYLNQWAALLKAKWNGIPTVLWGHGFSKSDRWWWRMARLAVARMGTCLLFYDSDTAESYQAQGWDPQKLFVAGNAIDHSSIEQARTSWQESPGRLQEFQKENQLDGGAVILYVSRLLPQNRLDLLLAATAKLSGQIQGLRTVIIGNGDKQRGHLEALAKKYGISDQTLFLNGIYNEEDLAPWFLSANVFCYPENIGLSILHAYWYGVPLVTSDKRQCQNPEIVVFQDQVNGLAYEHGNMDSLAGALRKLLEDASLRKSMSEAARETVENNYTVERMVDGIESAILYAAGSA